MIPKKVQFFKDKNINIRECVGGLYHSGAISMNGEVYLWGKGDALGQGPDDTKDKYIPTKVDYFNHMPVKCVSLGGKCSFVVSNCFDLKQNQSEEKEEVEKEWILKGDQPMNIKNGNDLRSKAFGDIFVRNRMLFGDLEWVMFMRRKYSAFPCCTTSFIESLRVTKDETPMDARTRNRMLFDGMDRDRIDKRYHYTIKLSGGMDGIDERYHSEIVNAKYLFSDNEEKTEIEKEYVENNSMDFHVFYGSNLTNSSLKEPAFGYYTANDRVDGVHVEIPSNEKVKGKGKEE
eukprot:436719_1